MSLYLHSKALFITSLACFSLLQQSELLGAYGVTYCNTGANNCGQCNRNYDSPQGPTTSLFGDAIACSDTSCSDDYSSSYCKSSCTGMFYVTDRGDDHDVHLYVDQSIQEPSDGGTPYYVSWYQGDNRYISYNIEQGKVAEIGFQCIDESYNAGYMRFDSETSSSTPTTNVLYLSNKANQFLSQTKFLLFSDVILQIDAGAINGLGLISFASGYLSVPAGGTVSCDFAILSGDKANLIGGDTSETPLILTGPWSGITALGSSDGDGSLQLNSGYINPQSGAFGGGGNIILHTECTLMIGNANALGNGSNILSPAGGTLRFLGDVILPNKLSFTIPSPGNLTVDMQGYDTGLSGTIDTSSSNVTLVVNDTSEVPGVLTMSPSSFPAQLRFDIKRGTLACDHGATITGKIALRTEGVLQTNHSTYSGELAVSGGSILVDESSQITGPMTGSSTLKVLRGLGVSSILDIHSAAGYTGLLSCQEDVGERIEVGLHGGLFNGKLDIGPAFIINYRLTTNSSIYGPIQSIGTYEPGSSPTNGASLIFENDTDGGAVTSTLTGGNITGNLFIDIRNTNGGTNTIKTNGYSITGCLDLELGCTLNLNNSASILTLVTNQEGVGISQINGNITGTGSVIIGGNTQFGSSTSTYPINSFSSLTLTSGVLSVWNLAALGGSAPTLYGNGGTIDNKTSITMTLTNSWIFNGRTTTKFQGGGSGIAFEIIGSIATGGSGSATINGNSELILNSSSLNIITGTSLLTNGTSVTTKSILGDGGLVLGGGTNLSPIDDILTVIGTSSYSGIISDSSYGEGIVRIQAPVTFLGNNTFSGGLYLDPAGILTINEASNLGAGTIYFNGGDLTLPLVGHGAIVLADNFLSFTSESSTVFSVAGSSSGLMELELTGNGTITGSPRTAAFTVTGGGVLTIADSADLGEGTYNVTVQSGVLAVNSVTTNLTYAPPFLDDGVLKGGQDSFFSLADASCANWKVTTVTPPLPSIINVTVEDAGFLAGEGDVTTAVIGAGGVIMPGHLRPGDFTVTESLIFDPGSTYVVKMDGSSASLLTVGGNTTLNDNVGLLVLLERGNYTASNFVILVAGNLEGEFTRTVSPEAFFINANLDYSVPNEIILSISPRFIQTGVTGTNAIAVANTLGEVIDWNRSHVEYEFPSLTPTVSPLIPDVLTSLYPLPVEEMSDALNQLQPAFFKGFTVIQENNIVKVQDALTLRMDSILQGNSCYSFEEIKECCNSNEKRIHAWISGLGDVLAQESNTFADSPQVGYQGKTYGFATGVDGTFAKFLYAGAMGGYTSSYIKWRGHQGTGNINTGYVGLYLSAISKMFYGNLSLIGGFSDMSSKRHIEYTGVDLTASGNHSGKQLLSHADTGINFSLGGFTIKPFDAFDYVSQTENSYVEKGAGQWGLSLKKSNAILLRNELGLEVSTCLCFKSMKWVVAPKASWVREVRVKGQSYTASFTEAAPADAPFTVTGYFPDRSLFSPGICLTGSMCQDKVSVELNYQGEFTHGYSDHSYGAEVRVNF